MEFGKPYTNVYVEDGKTFVHVQQITQTGLINSNGLTFDMSNFSHFMLQMRGLESEMIHQNKPKVTKNATKGHLKQRSKQYDKTAKMIMAEVYSQFLEPEIKSIVISQCVGCMVQSVENHDICGNRVEYIDNYFYDAMNTIDESAIKKNLQDNFNLKRIISKKSLLRDTHWCDCVKNILKSL